MDVQTLLDNLTSVASCKVCQKIYKQPRQLPCLHSFCLKCLNRSVAKAENGKIRCPLCQREVDVPESGTFQEFPSNFDINNLLDVLDNKQCSLIQVTCWNGCPEKNEGTSYCFDCSKFWCHGKCLIGHDNLPENKEHRVVALRRVGSRPPAICEKENREEELKYYCDGCEEAACQVCLNLEHGGHSIKQLDVAAREERKKILDKVQKAKTRITTFREDTKNAEVDWQNVQGNIESVKRKVHSSAEEMIRVIRESERQLIEEADKMKIAEGERFTANIEKIQNEVEKIDDQCNQAENLLQRGSNSEIVQSRKLVEEHLDQLMAEEPQTQAKTFNLLVFVDNSLSGVVGLLGKTATDRVQCTAEGSGLAEAIAGLKAQFTVSTKNSKGEVCYNPIDRIAVEIERREDKEPAKSIQINDNRNGTYQVSYFVTDPGEHDVRVTVNEENVRWSPFPPIQVKPRDFEPLMLFESRELAKPWGVAVNEHGEIAVSHHYMHTVEVFTSEGRSLFSFGGKGNEQGKLDFPRGVTYDRNGNLLVVDSGNNRIQQFSRTGQFIRTFGAQGELGGDLICPRGISSCPDGSTIVVDGSVSDKPPAYGQHNKRVVVFSQEGRVLLTLQNDRLDPFYCIFHNDRFIVSDWTGNCIKVYGKKGNFLYQFGEKGAGNGEFEEPGGLAIDKSGRLVVCDRGNNRVQLLELDGTFCCQFGAIDNFDRPMAVAVLENGQYAVTAYRSDRVYLVS